MTPQLSPGSPFAGRDFHLYYPKLELPPFPEESASPSRSSDDIAIPFNKPPDARYAEYFLDIKKAIEKHWAYPREAARKSQCGQLVLEFVVSKDGSVFVELVHSSGVEILDRYAINAVKLSAPLPPIPDSIRADRIRISARFSYTLSRPSAAESPEQPRVPTPQPSLR